MVQVRFYVICFLAGLAGAFAGYFLADWLDFQIASWFIEIPEAAKHAP